MTGIQLPVFRNATLLEQALTHRSYIHEHPGSGKHNERLEFLGDAVLNFLSGEYLFQRYPEKPEGELTPLRSALVDEFQLSKFASQLDLGERLRLGKGAQRQGGRQNPNLTSCAFEAVIGAYFLDQDSKMSPVRQWIIPFFDTVVDEMALVAPLLNTKSLLQAETQRRVQENPTYRIVDESGPDHNRQFVAEVWAGGLCLGRGQGKRKQDAEKAAAKDALERLGFDASLPSTAPR